MNKLLRIAVTLVAALVVIVGVVYLWASRSTAQQFARTIDTHRVDFPMPFPATPSAHVTASLAAAEVANGSAVAPEPEPDPRAAALERAEHLVAARYHCQDCHGENFGGGTMIDAMPLGRIFGPNLTMGAGSATRAFAAADWDRAVRHGVGSDGRPLMMPSAEFRFMSDQELSDIVTYIRSQPPVDHEVKAVTLGPVGKLMVARGAFGFAADMIPDHQADHAVYPPAAAPTAEFGRHLAATCTGCHQADYSGGDIGGDPSWPPAANLTPAGVMAGYDLDGFKHVLREGVRPDGSEVGEPMRSMLVGLGRMTDVEMEAIYAFLSSLPPRETVN